MLGLVKFCLETTAKEDASGRTSTNFEAMDPDRRAWLQQAMESMTVDTTRQILENLAIVKETISQMEKDSSQNVAVQKTCDALGVLTDLCEEIDYASDFAKLQGFTIFKPLIECSHEEMIVKACELLAALAQNNPMCQMMTIDTRLLELLLDFVHIKEDQSNVKARSYALYAISSIVRSNPEVLTHFETKLDGLTVLLHLLEFQPLDKMLDDKSKDDGKGSSVYWWRKLRIRSVFLFRTLCSESSNSSNYFYERQAIKKLADQLTNSHDIEVREHLLHALKALILSFDSTKRAEALKLTPNLVKVIDDIKSSIPHTDDTASDYDLADTRQTCAELLKIIKMVT